MQLTMFGDDANRAALSTNGFASKEPALLCPFQKKKKMEQQRNSTQKTWLGITALPSLFMCLGQVPPENLKRSGEGRNVIQR